MYRLNRFLLMILAILVIFSMVCSVVANSSEGNGSMNLIDQFDDDSNDVSVIDDSDSGNDNGSNGSVTVSLTNHSTANPVLLLFFILFLAGFSVKNIKK